MAKKKKRSFGIKTARYFTKTCSSCNFEYPNWFTNCPNCGMAWDENKIELENAIEQTKKLIKIIVKITEEDFDQELDHVQLVFSVDQGNSWYQMMMENKIDYFIAEIIDVPIGSSVIYFIEVYLKSGEKVIENNEGNYFHYTVGVPLEEPPSFYKQEPSLTNKESDEEKRDDAALGTAPGRKYFKPRDSKYEKGEKKLLPPKTLPQIKFSNQAKNYEDIDKTTIFGTPQTQVDPELKTCPHCNSRIKKMWSTCPICGKPI